MNFKVDKENGNYTISLVENGSVVKVIDSMYDCLNIVVAATNSEERENVIKVIAYTNEFGRHLYAYISAYESMSPRDRMESTAIDNIEAGIERLVSYNIDTIEQHFQMFG